MANGGIIGPVVTPPNVQTQSAPGVWTLQEAQEYIRQGLWPRRYDPLYNYTTLLLSGNGANNATNSSFLDSSSNNFTITRNGNTTQGTFSPFAQTGWGNYFDGTGDYLSVADNSVLRLGTSNFTIECWVNRAANGTAHSILAKGGASTGWLLEVTSGNLLQFTHTTTTITTSLPVYAGNWVHVAAVREGTGSNQFKLYINGTLAQTATMSTDFTQTDTLYIGANRSAATTMNGYISNVRIVNGTALYTAQFTPSTTPLTTTSQGATASQVELLTCQSNRFLDNSGNGFTVTPAGNSAVVSFSPFNATRPWDPLTYGGGGYFDGNGDYLSVADNAALNIGTADYQISCWIYPTVFNANSNAIVGKGSSNIIFYYNSSGVLSVAQYGVAVIATASQALVLNQWSYITVSRVSNVSKIFINSTEVASASDTSNYTSSTALQVGQDPNNATQKITGYLADFRFVKNSGVTSVTVPTAPLTAITNTSLLLNFTNIGVTDATSKNILETVGDAKISTAQSKFGGSSIVFDGTGDYLSVVSTSLLGYGTGNFTIEFWTYVTSTSNTPYFFDCRTTATANEAVPALYINAGNYEYYVSGAARITTGAVPTNQWVHVALVRNSGTTTLYSNGTSTGTWSDSTNYISCPMVIGQRKDTTSQSLNGYIQDFRITKGVARYTENFAVPDSAFATLGNTPPSIDPYFDYTTLLLPGSGSNNATNSSFLDSSANNFTITRNGNTTQGTFSPFSQTGWGNYFDGTGDKLTVAANTAFQFGTGDFCIEFWLYPVLLSNYQTPIDMGYNGSGSYIIQTGNGNGIPTFFTAGSALITSSTAWTANSFNHIVVCRSGTTLSMFINGSRTATASNSTNFNSNSTLGVGAAATASSDYPINGYMSNVRLVKGTAVYDPSQSTLSVPTTPLTAITNTSLLTCQSNRFIDNSTNNFTITVNGNTSVVAFSPFNPTASWSAATYGGSGYFDGSGDYLSAGSGASETNLSGDSSIEVWFYPLATNKVLTAKYGGGTNQFYINCDSSNKIYAEYLGSTFYAKTSTGSYTLNAWNHLLITKSSTTAKMWLNGVYEGSWTVSSVNSSTNAITIGSSITGGAFFNGYIGGAKYSNIAVETGTSNITVPTTPMTAGTGTVLLLNFTNAGIYDATSKNDLETVADAKISTAQSVWTAYGSSMYFDGTGDYLTTVSKQEIIIGTSTFTAEAWVYLTSSTTNQCIFGGSSANNPFALYINSSTQIAVDQYGTSEITFAVPTISLNTWYHIAVVRNSTTTRVYLNGTESTTGGVSDSRNFSGATNQIGANQTSNRLLTGYIQDARITKGIARYTANFQPPSAPLALR